MSKNLNKAEKKLQDVMIKLFSFDPYSQPLEAKKFDWPWKSPKPVIRVYADSSPVIEPPDDENKKT